MCCSTKRDLNTQLLTFFVQNIVVVIVDISVFDSDADLANLKLILHQYYLGKENSVSESNVPAA